MKLAKIILLLASALLFSCKGDKGAEEAAAVAFAQNPLLISCESAVLDCGLVCNASWSASSKDSWVTVLTSEGAAGDPLKIRVSSNTSDDERNATVTVKAGSAGKVLQIVQYGNVASGFISESKVTLDTYGTASNITVTSDSGWNFQSDGTEWLHLEQRSATVLNISADINFTGSDRTASFIVRATDGSREATVSVTQQFNNEKFKASTVYGRRLVYAMGEFVSSVSKDTFAELTPGVISFEMTAALKDSFGGDTSPLVRKIYLFEVDMTKATVVATLKNDSDANVNTTQQMTAQLNALQNSRTDITVWGGTNGDFFSVAGDGNTCTLQGVLYRRGNCLKDSFTDSVCSIFAVFKDGSARCMSQTEYQTVKGNIREAVGGRQTLLSDGVKISFTDTRQEPRTAIGTSEDGKTVWMLVVDGRHDQYSTGSYSVSYDVLARILKAAGAYDAINLDGGGSSTYVVRSSSGALTKHNEPANSNRTERAVLDGLAVVN